jgi:hypothetical protein
MKYKMKRTDAPRGEEPDEEAKVRNEQNEREKRVRTGNGL